MLCACAVHTNRPSVRFSHVCPIAPLRSVVRIRSLRLASALENVLGSRADHVAHRASTKRAWRRTGSRGHRGFQTQALGSDARLHLPIGQMCRDIALITPTRAKEGGAA